MSLYLFFSLVFQPYVCFLYIGLAHFLLRLFLCILHFCLFLKFTDYSHIQAGGWLYNIYEGYHFLIILYPSTLLIFSLLVAVFQLVLLDFSDI